MRLGADCAALLSERDIFRRSNADRIFAEPDVSERIDTLHRWRRGNGAGSNLDTPALKAVDRTSKQLLRLMPEARDQSPNDALDPEMLSRLLIRAFPDRICKRREEGNRSYVLAGGRGVRLSPDSHLVSNRYLIAVTVDAGEKAEGFIHVAAPVTEELIRSECGKQVETVRRTEWDHKEGRIVAALEERLETLLLSRKPFTPADEEAAPILCEVIRTTPGILAFSREAKQFQARVGLLKAAFPEEPWPDLSAARLLSKPEEWLLPWLAGIRSAQRLASLNILPALKAKLSWEQQRLLDERAPLSLTVPSGSRVALDYSNNDQPVLAVKLQEMFGLADTPRIAGGRVKVLLHLLSPARRPVQVTQDLKGFWNNGYQQVKKELKGRYPRHPWPDDPWNAVPTRRTKPRGQ
jgi:ATP-dependent helicase HrpB